jgi:adenosine deaminase
VQVAFDLSVEEWRLIATNAIDGSWCSDERKNKIHDAVRLTIDKFVE